MKSTKRFRGFTTILMLVLSVLLGAAVLLQGTAGAADQPKPCCFANEKYDGICTVYPTGDETCGDILAYLNNPMATGKTYCGNTHIRGGWHQVECK